mmetsp:Transcript_3616/g.9123  ORF Transcript_3616/g.9123 Transcript_3616/m.9123 type:complete len:262 (-) Transcript_3616:201-986(-)
METVPVVGAAVLVLDGEVDSPTSLLGHLSQLLAEGLVSAGVLLPSWFCGADLRKLRLALQQLQDVAGDKKLVRAIQLLIHSIEELVVIWCVQGPVAVSCALELCSFKHPYAELRRVIINVRDDMLPLVLKLCVKVHLLQGMKTHDLIVKAIRKLLMPGSRVPQTIQIKLASDRLRYSSINVVPVRAWIVACDAHNVAAFGTALAKGCIIKALDTILLITTEDSDAKLFPKLLNNIIVGQGRSCQYPSSHLLTPCEAGEHME